MAIQLQTFSVSGLFGIYSHTVTLNTDKHISVIIGPNGRGKTVCLRLIDAMFNRKFAYFAEVPFHQILFTFSNGDYLKVHKHEPSNDDDDHTSAIRNLVIEFPSETGKIEDWKLGEFPSGDPRIRHLTRFLPFLERVTEDIWIDTRDGEEVSLREISELYGDRLPNRISRYLESNEPDRFQQLVNSINCSLIETQRLLVLSEDEWSDEYRPQASRRRRQASSSRYAVEDKARSLRQIIRGTLAQYANLSQSLDRSFPRRVLRAKFQASLTETEIRSQLERLDQNRQELMHAGILDQELEPVSMDGGDIESGVAQVLDVYIEDTAKKLKVFDGLLEKIMALTEIVNERFIDKKLRVDREHGFTVLSQGEERIPLDKLSSGEQHQLILIYDLLFEVKKNSLILIDEPELSLHVSWQKTFIESLERMIALNGFDVVIATHSPPLVAKHFDLTTELGDVEEMSQ